MKLQEQLDDDQQRRVQPLAAGRQLTSLVWETRRYEPGRESTLQHAALVKFGNGGSQLVWMAVGMETGSATKRQARR